MNSIFFPQPTIKNCSLLFVLAFFIRAALFYSYVQYQERYKQADSNDYHVAALVITYTGTMTRFDNQEPIFWRTPGYPAFLVPFYHWYGLTTGAFSSYTAAQKTAIWLQIFLCSLIPIILLFLALQLTSSLIIAWITGWISVFHLGFALASTYLLTDALASLFFYLFLLFFYRVFWVRGEPVPPYRPLVSLIMAVVCLSLYTWMRPMGQFVGIFSSVLLLFSSVSWGQKITRAMLFLTLFFATLAPWYVRNYQLTHQLFFCPMSGAYLQAFSAPKLVRRATGLPLEDCLRRLYAQVMQEAQNEELFLRAQGSQDFVVKHLVCNKVAVPWLWQYPWYAAYDWMVQVFKTMFDLYATQLVALAHNTFSYDPIEEFLTEKVAAALYAKPLPVWMRVTAWMELVCLFALWLTFFIGLWRFVVQPLYVCIRHKKKWTAVTALWLKTVPLVGAVCFMTGGFGYARLRIPIEPLIIILALTVVISLQKKISPPKVEKKKGSTP